jgi:hypothetical protein
VSGSSDLDLSRDMMAADEAEFSVVAELEREPSDLAFTNRSDEGCRPNGQQSKRASASNQSVQCWLVGINQSINPNSEQHP